MARPRKNPLPTDQNAEAISDELDEAEGVEGDTATESPEGEEAPKPAAVATVRMVRDDRYPEPHTADVHPDEVANWKLCDWVEA